MTHDETMDALCRRIAELREDRAFPGESVRDPETGATWRMMGVTGGEWQADNDTAADMIGEDIERELDAPLATTASIDRAIASGPNWRDEVTVLGLLALLPDWRIERCWPPSDGPCTRNWWCVNAGADAYGIASTRTEAIIRAVVAHLESK